MTHKQPPPSPPKTPKYERKAAEVRRRELIDAAIRCLGEGGMSAFTVDQICREAGVSKGLVNHYFENKESLLVSVYEVMTQYLYRVPDIEMRRDTGPRERLRAMVDASFGDSRMARPQLRAWLTLWGEIITNRKLQALHRQRYRAFKQGLIETISGISSQHGVDADSEQLARLLIAAIDGLWLEHCLDPEVLSLESAKADCYRLLEDALGVGLAPFSTPDRARGAS